MLSYAEKNILIARIASGTFKCVIRGCEYIVRSPDRDTRYAAQRLYEDTLSEVRFQEWLDNERINNILVQNELLTKDNEANLKEIENRIEDLKIDLYNALFNPTKQKEIRELLSRVRTKQEEMYRTKHMFDSFTSEGFAASIRDEFLLANSIYYNGTKLWPTPDSVSYYLLEDILSCINQDTLTISDFRELARTEPWRGYWGIAKSNVFKESVIDWTDEQRTLAMFSKLYDSVFESHEFPGDDVVNDDDMLDGWLALAKRERDKQCNDSNVDKLLLKNVGSDAGEIFVPVKSQEEANKIHGMNDTQAKFIKKQRQAQIKKQGGMAHQNLADQRLELQQMATEQYKQHFKGDK